MYPHGCSSPSDPHCFRTAPTAQFDASVSNINGFTGSGMTRTGSSRNFSLSVDEQTTRLGGEDKRRRDKSRASTLRTSMDQQTSEDETRRDYQLSLEPFPTLISMV